MQDKSVDNIIQYSLGQPPARTGLGGFSMKATVIIAVGFLAFLFLQLLGFGKFGLLVVLPLTAIAAAVVSVKFGGRSIAETIQIVWQARMRASKKEHFYVSGPSSRIPGGHYQLPGLLARTELVSAIDADGQEFVVVLDRPRREATVLLSCQMTGQIAMTQQERNTQTAEWSRFLASLSHYGDVESAVVVVSTRPGSGSLIHKEVASVISPDAPALARTIMQEAAQTISTGIPEVDTHLAMTIRVEGEALSDESYLSQLANRIPAWCEALSWAGVIAEPMNENDAVARIHAFYDPASEADFEELSVANVDHGIQWENAGPASAVAEKTRYKHDGCVSVSWEMREAPKATFEDMLLRDLIAPHDRIPRKRVALVYRPYEAGSGTSRVEAEHRDAMVAANSSKKITSAKAEMRLEHTEAARRAQARGAQLGRYSMFVTATTDEEKEVPRMIHEVEHLGAGASIKLKITKYQQDAIFQVSTGMGQLPWNKSTTSKAAGA